jgi:hypothetical protein
MALEIKAWIATLIYFEPPGLDAGEKALSAERESAWRQLNDFWRRNQHLF